MPSNSVKVFLLN